MLKPSRTTKRSHKPSRIYRTSKSLIHSNGKNNLILTKHPTTHLQPSTTFQPTKPQFSSDKFGDSWTKQARALGYPSRAVFKLLEANKKYNILTPGDVVVDLGCSPGSWSKLSSSTVGGNGFVLGMDLTTLSEDEQLKIGVRKMDINKRFDYPKSYDDGLRSNTLLPSEKKLLKTRAPVGYMQQDVTQWIPGEGFKHQVDVILSDMAPNTTGVTSYDSSNSIELCYKVIDLCSQLFKPPSTKIQQFTNRHEKQQAMKDLKMDPNNENILIDHLTQEYQKNIEKQYGTKNQNIISATNITTPIDSHTKDSGQVITPLTQSSLHHQNNKINLKMVKKTVTKYIHLQKSNAIGIIDTEEESAVYKTNERTLSQIKGNEQISTTWRGTLIMKVFQGEGITDLMKILKQIFVSTYTFKPQASRSESVEIFIICKGYCGPFDYTRITNKHIRRPRTEEYLHQYKSNNLKPIPIPHDPTQSPRFFHNDGLINENPIKRTNTSILDPTSKTIKPNNRETIEQLYARLGANESTSYTNDEFYEQQQQDEENKYHLQQLQQTINSGVTTNVHAVIKNTASLDPGAMSPLQREISQSDDIVVYQKQQFDQLFERERVMNQVPDTQSLIKSMSLYWDEGINFAKKASVEAQTPTRVDIFAERTKFIDQFKQDEVSAILDDTNNSNVVTAQSIQDEYAKGTKGGKKLNNNSKQQQQSIIGDDGYEDDDQLFAPNVIDAIIMGDDNKNKTKTIQSNKTKKGLVEMSDEEPVVGTKSTTKKVVGKKSTPKQTTQDDDVEDDSSLDDDDDIDETDSADEPVVKKATPKSKTTTKGTTTTSKITPKATIKVVPVKSTTKSTTKTTTKAPTIKTPKIVLKAKTPPKVVLKPTKKVQSTQFVEEEDEEEEEEVKPVKKSTVASKTKTVASKIKIAPKSTVKPSKTSTSIDTTNEVIPKRKPGRPPKPKQVDDNDAHVENVPVVKKKPGRPPSKSKQVQDDGIDVPIVKRKPGRPPSKPKAEPILDENGNIVKKKPGRPKRVVVEELNDGDDNNNNNNDNNDDVPIKNKIVKKKTGRPATKPTVIINGEVVPSTLKVRKSKSSAALLQPFPTHVSMSAPTTTSTTTTPEDKVLSDKQVPTIRNALDRILNAAKLQKNKNSNLPPTRTDVPPPTTTKTAPSSKSSTVLKSPTTKSPTTKSTTTTTTKSTTPKSTPKLTTKSTVQSTIKPKVPLVTLVDEPEVTKVTKSTKTKPTFVKQAPKTDGLEIPPPRGSSLIGKPVIWEEDIPLEIREKEKLEEKYGSKK